MTKIVRNKHAQKLPANQIIDNAAKYVLHQAYEAKMLEELASLHRSGYKKVEDWANLIDVIQAWANLHGISKDQIKKFQTELKKIGGDYSQNLIWEKYKD